MSESFVVEGLRPAPPHLANDPVLRRAKQGLREIYGNRLTAVIVYGSRARGDHRPDSDYDLIALIRNFDPERDRGRELYDLESDLFQLEPNEIEVNIRALDDRSLEQRTGFMFNVRKEGMRL